MENYNNNMEIIYKLMPAGWKEAAKTKKALRRGRNIKTPEELLRLNFLYQTHGGTYGLTSALTQISENQIGLNKTAVEKRIVNSASWLKWLCENLSRQEGFIVSPPSWLKKYNVNLVDASDYSCHGSRGSDFRFHYMMNLFTMNTVEMYFTTAAEGETLTRYKSLKENDLIVADRGYCSISEIHYVIKHNADYVIRMRSNSFNLYTEDKKKFDVTKELKSAYTPGRRIELKLFMKDGKEYIPVRICAVAKTDEDIKKSQRQMKKSNHHRKPLSELQTVWSHFVVAVTSLDDSITTEQVLELYRMRWQIELVFKRFKSIFGGREFTARKEEPVKAWFYGKLLLAIVCETLAKKGRFSPSEQSDGDCETFSVERTSGSILSDIIFCIPFS